MPAGRASSSRLLGRKAHRRLVALPPHSAPRQLQAVGCSFRFFSSQNNKDIFHFNYFRHILYCKSFNLIQSRFLIVIAPCPYGIQLRKCLRKSCNVFFTKYTTPTFPKKNIKRNLTFVRSFNDELKRSLIFPLFKSTTSKIKIPL